VHTCHCSKHTTQVIIRRHCAHAVHRCSPLLQTWHGLC